MRISKQSTVAVISDSEAIKIAVSSAPDLVAKAELGVAVDVRAAWRTFCLSMSDKQVIDLMREHLIGLPQFQICPPLPDSLGSRKL